MEDLFPLKTFSKELRDFLWTDEVLKLIPDFGWNDGGCRSLMAANRLWLGTDNTEPYQIVKTKHQEHSEHALVRVGQWFLDGEGVWERSQLIQHWIEEEGMPGTSYLRPFEPSTEPLYEGEIPYYIPDTDIRKLAAMLEERFNKEEVLRLLTAQ